MGRLTTHVLDTALGRPGAGIRVRLYRAGPERALLGTTVTNAEGRTDDPLLADEGLRAGTYELTFDVGAYLSQQG